jgi:hypothetical protein
MAWGLAGELGVDPRVLSLRQLYRMVQGRRSLLGGLARFQAVAAGLVARGVDPAKVPDPFPRPSPPKPPPDPVENHRKMAAFVKGLLKHKRRK